MSTSLCERRRGSRFLAFPTWVAVWLILVQSGQCQTLHTRDGIFFDAESVEILDQGFRFADADGSVLCQASLSDSDGARRLLRWGSWEGVRSRSAIWMANGSWLCGNIEFMGDSIRIASKWLEPIEIPLNQIRGVIFEASASKRNWLEMLSAMQSANGTADRVWLQNGSELSGVAQLSQSPDSIKIEVKSNGATVALDRSDVRYMIFSPALLGPLADSREVLEVGLSDGSLLRSTGLDSSAGNVRMLLGSGVVAESIDSRRRFSKELRFLFDGRAKSNYLAEMKVAQYRHISASSTLRWSLGVNEDVYGRPLFSHNGSTIGLVHSGLAMHSASQVAFRWDGTPGRLLAELEFAMVTEGARPDLGRVRCKVLVARDGKLLTFYDQLLHRDGKREPSRRSVDVDVSGSQLIVLVVEEDELGAFGDHIQWLDARVASIPNE